ncbi:MAG: pentapeptide repeat-containing protein [Coprobacillaceae bacterium]
MKIYEEKEFKDIIKKADYINDIEFHDCIFVNCNIQENNISDCLFKQCTFKNCTIINNDFSLTYLSENDFEDCTIIGVSWAELVNNNHLFSPINSISNCVLRYNDFYEMKLTDLDFSNCDFTGSIFESCNFTKTSFKKSEFKESTFTSNNLSLADFRQAKNYFIDPSHNIIKQAKFTYPDVLNLLASFNLEIE